MEKEILFEYFKNDHVDVVFHIIEMIYNLSFCELSRSWKGYWPITSSPLASLLSLAIFWLFMSLRL